MSEAADAKPASQGSDPAALGNPAPPVLAQLDPTVAEQLPANLSKFFDKEGNFNLTAASTSVQQAEQKITELSAPPAAPAAADDLSISRGADAAEATIEQLLVSAGTNKDAVVKEYVDNQGKLTDATYQKLRGVNITRAMADLGARAFALEQQAADSAVATALTDARNEATGGAEGVDGGEALRNLLDWAGRSGAFTVQEMNAIDAQLHHPDTTRMAVQTLKARHQQEMGADRAEPLIEGGVAAAGGAIQVTAANHAEVKARAMAGSQRHQQAYLQAQQDGTLARILL
jgi:hypothetical protein